MTGDLANTGDPAEYAVVRELLEPLAMPVHPLPGNHDDPAALRAAFADHPDVAATTGAVHYGVEIGDLHVLVLDTWAPGTDAGTLDAGQLEWLDGALAGVGNPQRTLIAMHHPPMAIGIGALDTIGIDPESLAAFAEILQRRGGVARIVAGHVHRSVTGTFAGCPVFAAASVAFQSALDLRPGNQSFARARGEPAAIALHVHAPGLPLVSHVHPVTA